VLDTSIDFPPFHLHLVGAGNLDVPVELEHVVVFHSDLTYDQYYRVMQGMDLCVPGIADGDAYYEFQGSSTSTMCMEVDVSWFSLPFFFNTDTTTTHSFLS
jgi:hypothetical protein